MLERRDWLEKKDAEVGAGEAAPSETDVIEIGVSDRAGMES